MLLLKVDEHKLDANHDRSNNIDKLEFIDINGKNSSKYTKNYTINLIENRENMLKILTKVFMNNEKWQRQETGLIISYEIIQKVLSESLNNMNKKEWIEIKISNGILSLLYALRNYLYLAALHPMFEIRRMISQILPIIARATILFQPESLLIEADFIPTKPHLTENDNIPTKPHLTENNNIPTKHHLTENNNIPTKPHLTEHNNTSIPSKPHLTEDNNTSISKFESDSNISVQSCDSIDIEYLPERVLGTNSLLVRFTSGIGADSKAVVLCTWLAAVSKASQHLIELDMIDTPNNSFQKALQSYGIRTLNDSVIEGDTSAGIFRCEYISIFFCICICKFMYVYLYICGCTYV
jgi:hypothetical protein